MRFFMQMLSYLFHVVFSYVRPLFKFVVRKITGKCEISRIVANYPKGASRTLGIENSLRNSKNNCVRKGLFLDKSADAETYVRLVMKVKGINLNQHPNFPIDYAYCINQINSYRELTSKLEVLRSTEFNWEDKYHAELLSRLWGFLCPSDHETSHKQWVLLGFQTENPGTDFRGMGLLSLENLVYFAETHTKLARSISSASNHPKKWYPFALAGINLTKLLYSFMLRGYLKNQFYNTSSLVGMQDFNEFYCYTFYSFHEFWMKTSRDIMLFNEYRDDFENKLKKRLLNINCRLCLPEGK
uniref:ELMO domain-containing protein n=1 Tax=Trichobilharzia regenti TaxID=157069 RepID=A0AA85IPD4_TRIRE|nr:unnamed protein product [Trichobilharzia regenti]